MTKKKTNLRYKKGRYELTEYSMVNNSTFLGGGNFRLTLLIKIKSPVP